MRPDKALSSQKNTIRDLIKQGMRILDKHFEAFKLIGCVSEKLKNSKKLNFLFFFSISYDAPKALKTKDNFYKKVCSCSFAIHDDCLYLCKDTNMTVGIDCKRNRRI